MQITASRTYSGIYARTHKQAGKHTLDDNRHAAHKSVSTASTHRVDRHSTNKQSQHLRKPNFD